MPSIDIIARVSDEYLTRDELANWMPPNLPDDQKVILARQYVDRWVHKTVMARSALNDGLSLSDYEQWSMEYLEKEMLSQKYLAAKLPRDIIITDEEISTYYEENKEQFIRSEDEVHLVQLFLESMDKAIAEEIKEEKELLDVIKKNYLDTQVNRILEKNGDLGYVPVNSLRKEIVRYVKSGSTGRIYGPIRIEGGYYYFQMMDKQSADSYRSLDLVREEIELRLKSIKREKLAEEIVRKQSEKFTIEIYPEHIK
ncbi:MAG: peptidyl-prolyl cis-trans isomerase [Calditrichaeota bacterium]|nr:peptidyl-prolyl cis-trans isomerase [Calditrichota bacterium]